MVKQLILDGHFGSNFGYIGGQFGCAYEQISVLELVNVTNGFLDPTNKVIDTQIIILRKTGPTHGKTTSF
jgi:hypothetical protein